MKGQNKKRRRYLGLGLGSLAIHLLALTFFSVWLERQNRGVSNDLLAIEMPSVELKADSNERKMNDQIVDSHSGKLSETPPDNSFLGEKNRTVKTQISAVTQEKAHHQKQARQGQKPAEAPTKKIELGLDWTRDVVAKADSQDGSAGPTTNAQEYVKGLPQGAQEALNTREFMYFTYFQRMRDQLSQAWRPLLRSHVAEIYKRGRRLAVEMEYTTQTLFTLNSSGEVIRVQVIDESGAHDLDAAAVDSLNRAGPFPNPPSGLLGQNKEIQIRWDFVLKT